MAATKVHEKAVIWMTGSYSVKDLLFKRAEVREKLSMLTETTVEFLSKKTNVKLEDLLGKNMTIHVQTEGHKERLFTGTITSVEGLGFRDGYSHFVAELRPWYWMLTRTRDSRIFQDKSVIDIMKEVFGDHGFGEFKDSTKATYKKRDYCVQYRESDFDFLNRLFEEEGIYYFFDHAGSDKKSEKLVLADGVSAHSPVPEKSKLDFYARDASAARRGDHVAEWARQEYVQTGKVTLQDFDFLSPSADLKTSNAIKHGKHSHNKYEAYDYPGHYRKDTGLGNSRARVRMESEAVQHALWRGAATVRTLATGATFSLKGHSKDVDSDEYLVTEATYYLQTTSGYDEVKIRHDLDANRINFPEDMNDIFSVVFGAIPKKEQFRAPLETSWPEIAGMHTAIVTGPKGEEIHTDEHGRIKVQFHWDRDGKKDDKSSCWVRVVTPWSGKNWGMIHIPRIGQEVAIQFEEGDPDRPICTGMLYNKETKPPYALPANKTQSGIKTNSSKKGGGFNELMFEDKKDAELVRFQAEKDYEQIVKNNAEILIGLAKKDKGNLTQTVQNDVTETIKKGDHTFTIETGSQIIKIKTDKTVTIDKDKTQTVKGKNTRTITGNDTTEIKQGNQTNTVKMGNHTNEVKMGNITVKANLGKIAMQALQSIELKCGASTIKMTPASIEIKSPMIKAQGQAMVQVKAPITQVNADAMLLLKGGITLIN